MSIINNPWIFDGLWWIRLKSQLVFLCMRFSLRKNFKLLLIEKTPVFIGSFTNEKIIVKMGYFFDSSTKQTIYFTFTETPGPHAYEAYLYSILIYKLSCFSLSLITIIAMCFNLKCFNNISSLFFLFWLKV